MNFCQSLGYEYVKQSFNICGKQSLEVVVSEVIMAICDLQKEKLFQKITSTMSSENLCNHLNLAFAVVMPLLFAWVWC